jgi:hypothetical protein
MSPSSMAITGPSIRAVPFQSCWAVSTVRILNDYCRRSEQLCPRREENLQRNLTCNRTVKRLEGVFGKVLP